MSITKELKYKLSRLSIAEKLIVINVFVFVINAMIPFLFQLNKNFISNWFQLPENFTVFIKQPWSIITYSFFHGDISHILFNMILLFFVGRIFLNLFSAKKFINVYFLGVILGGVFFLLSYNLFPAFLGVNSVLVGASAGVMAILIFVCSYIPNQEVRVIFFNVKLWHIGLFFVLLDLVRMTYGDNAGGHIAHLGGASLGYFYAKNLLNGRDIGSGFEKMSASIANLFKSDKKSPLKTVHRNRQAKGNTTTAAKKSIHQKQIDDILDKISKSGYESLSKEEKDFLFKAGKE